MIRRVAVLGTVLVALGILGLWIGREEQAPALVPGLPAPTASVSARARAGGMHVNFLVTADTHFGYQVPPDPDGVTRSLEDARGIERVHRVAIAAMNEIEGKPYPPALGGVVGKPLGLLVAGDLTEDGKPREWARFEGYLGLDGSDGMLRYPVFEGIGNHDKHYGFYVKDQVKKRHGAQIYSWDWQDLHLVCLGEAPDHEDLNWLARDLERAGREVAVVLYFHFPLEGPYSRGHWFGEGDYKDALERTISGYQVVGIFHGHYHGSGAYRWRGYDVYNVGSAKHGYRSFAVVELTDERMRVASYQYEQKRWWWWHEKPLFGAAGEQRRWSAPGAGLVGLDGWP